MSEYFTGIDPKVNYDEKFKDKFAKVADMPQSRCINAFLHPEYPKVIVSVNKVVFPKAEKDNITALMGGQAANNVYNFEEDILRMSQLMKSKTLAIRSQDKKVVEDSQNFSDPDSNLFDQEGGEPDVEEDEGDLIDLKKLGFNATNQIIVDEPPNIKGKYSKVRNRLYLKQLKKKLANAQKSINMAVDAYLNKHLIHIPKDDMKRFEENIMARQDEDENASLYDSEDLSDYSFDEEMMMRKEDGNVLPEEIKYVEIPSVNNHKYIPPPFRYKYEICYWKLNTHNIVKLKSYYFTPQIRSEVYSCQAHLSIDKKSIVIVLQELIHSTKAHVCIFPLKDIQAEEEHDPQWGDQDKYQKDEEKYRKPVELIVDISDDKVENPFSSTDDGAGSGKNTKYGFEFTEKNLNGNDEMKGMRVTCWNNGRYVLSSITQSPK